MKRALVILSLLGPICLLIALALVPSLDPEIDEPVFHFYIVTFSTFVAAVVAIFMTLTLGRESAPRHSLLATAFAAMGAIFLVHGLTTPGVLITTFHPAIQWAAWLTLFTGGILFALAARDKPERPLKWLYLRLIIGTVVAGYVSFMLVVTLAPQRLIAIENLSAPWNVPLIFLTTLLAWAYAAFGLWQTWRITGRRIDGLMTLIAVWFMIGTISMHQYPVFHLSWWLYHLLILAGALTAMFGLAAEYEQFRRFSLTRYYALTSLVVMAALALLTSYFFTELIYHDLADIQAVVRARLISLLIASFSMGTLFLVLLTIVRRADQLITGRAEELVQAYADLQAAEAMRDDLTDMIVHDLRSPLTAIITNLDLLERVIEDPSLAETSQRFRAGARKSAQRMIEMINGLLDLARLESGQLNLSLSPLVVSELLQERAQAFASQAQAEGKYVDVRAPEDLAAPPADIAMITRVLDNLIGNAFKYTRASGHIVLGAEQNGTTLFLSVADDGEGVPIAYAERIFDKFAQLTTKNGAPLGNGAGLGLAFCKLAVEAHGGCIWLDTAREKGSRFVFTLPLQTQPVI